MPFTPRPINAPESARPLRRGSDGAAVGGIPFELTRPDEEDIPPVEITERVGKPKRKSGDQKKRKGSGKVGEAFAEMLHAQCLADNVAHVVKIATPMQIVGSLGPGLFKCVYTAKAGVDYVGSMRDGTGRAVYVEVKHVSDPAAPFDMGDMRAVQVAQLEDKSAGGCVCVLVIVRGGHGYAIPWTQARGYNRIGTAELAPHWIPAGFPYLKRWSRE